MSSKVSYIQLAHNYWDKDAGHPRAKVLYNFGLEENLDKEGLRRLVQSINRYLGPEDGTQAGIPPAVQEPLILDLMALRARFCPRVTMLATGQMPLVAMHVNAGRTLWQPSRTSPWPPW